VYPVRVFFVGQTSPPHDPRRALAIARERLSEHRHHLDRACARALHDATKHLNAIDARLHALSPLAVLDRGYALVQGSDGTLIRSSAQLAPGDKVTTRLSRGSFVSRVEEAHAEPAGSQRKVRKK
jgi:exodeoxyribonuclease VII large subunit